ncbi:hypothetical protein, partial [Brevibacillus borstelensis]|uniref:hypothetical protein n=1 Tax=Brevibacillus borstelensis TaxID=45462 RepID=UPI001C11E94A
RASTLGFLHQLPVSYEVTWLLPRLDFHQLAINGLLGTLQIGRPAPPRIEGGAGFLCCFCRLSEQAAFLRKGLCNSLWL